MWDRAYEAASATRFIPVELWTGGDWDGSRVERAASVTHPDGQTFQVYERLNSGKRQLMNEGKGRGTDMTYTYSPGRGLVHLDGKE